jgi:hypothetical protein
LELCERAKRRSFGPSGHLNKIKGRDYSGAAIQAEAQNARVPARIREQHKHRSLIDNHFRMSIEDSDDFGLTICAFRFEGRRGEIKSLSV